MTSTDHADHGCRRHRLPRRFEPLRRTLLPNMIEASERDIRTTGAPS